MLNSFLKSYFIGMIAYILSALWLSQASLDPTLKTNHVGYLYNAVGLLFWVITFILYEKDRRKNG